MSKLLLGLAIFIVTLSVNAAVDLVAFVKKCLTGRSLKMRY